MLKDLEFLYEAMLQWKNNREITDVELADLSSCMRVVARHITDGNEIEDEVVKAMGGEIIELPSDRLRETEEKIAKAEKKIAELNARADDLQRSNENLQSEIDSLQKSNYDLLVELGAYKEKYGNI